jgi:hypothetical protein
MPRIATVRPVGHIGQRNVRRRVGPFLKEFVKRKTVFLRVDP